MLSPYALSISVATSSILIGLICVVINIDLDSPRGFFFWIDKSVSSPIIIFTLCEYFTPA